MSEEKKIEINLEEIAQLQNSLSPPQGAFAFQILLKLRLPNPRYEIHDGEKKLVVDFPVHISPSTKELPNLALTSQAIIFKKPVQINVVWGAGHPNTKILQFLMLRSVFESECSITMLAEQLDLRYCTFQNFKLVNSEIDYLSLEESKIQGVAEFSAKGNDNVLTTCNFKRTEFNGGAKFKKLPFRGGVDFKEAKLTNCDFTKTKFEDEADFKEAKFYGENIFEYTQFNERGAFKGAYFDSNPVFNKLILGSESQMYFSQLNKNSKPIDRFTIRDTIINGRLDLDDNNITILDMKGSVVAGTLSRVQFSNIACANWETACILKNEELKRNNIIKALEYKAEEKNLYICKNGSEQFSLWLSWISNNHGQSWKRGVGFTLVVWLLFFTLFYLSLLGMNDASTLYYKVFKQDLNFNSYISLMIQYLSPTDYQMLADYIQNTPNKLLEWIVKFSGICFYLLGKALVPYGIYEVVQAFRKFNKID